MESPQISQEAARDLGGSSSMLGHSIAAVGPAPLPSPAPADSVGPEATAAAADELSSMEDVERIVNEKFWANNQFDYKGKSEQMIPYIRKLRSCIRWLMERDNLNLAEKHAAIKSYEEEKELRLAVERLRDTLTLDLAKADQKEKRLIDQIKGLEETNKRVLEYNTSLQQFSSTLQTEASKNHETISKLSETVKDSLTALGNNMTSMNNQLAEALKNHETICKLNEEKNTMKESLTALRNEIISLKNQLDTSKVQDLKE